MCGAEWASAQETFYVPTIDHNRYYANHRNEYGYDEGTGRELRAFVQSNVESLRLAHQAGIPIAFGSYAVMTMLGQNTLELEWFVKAGLSPAETIKTATLNAAELCGLENQLGRILPTFQADIIAVCGNPLSDIQAITNNIAVVIKAGKIAFYNPQKAACP